MVYELSSSPPQPRRDPDASGHRPALPDGHPCIGIYILSEFLFLGRLGRGNGVGHDRFRAVFEGQEKLGAGNLQFILNALRHRKYLY